MHTNSEASTNNFLRGVCTQKFGDHHLDQGSVNCGLQTTVFVKFYWPMATPTHLPIS